MDKTYNIKVCLNKEIHIYRGQAVYQNLKQYIEKVFKSLENSGEYSLTYIDEDNDHISISCDEDILALCETTKKPKIFINGQDYPDLTNSTTSFMQSQNFQQQQQQPKQEQKQQNNQQQQCPFKIQDLLGSFMGACQQQQQQQQQNQQQFDLGGLLSSVMGGFQQPQQRQEQQQANNNKFQEDLMKSFGGFMNNFKQNMGEFKQEMKKFEQEQQQQQKQDKEGQESEQKVEFDIYNLSPNQFCEQKQEQEQQQQNKQEYVHTHIICDVCNVNPIRGIRYKCLIRDDYDLCSDCYSIPANTENFEFEAIENSQLYYKQKDEEYKIKREQMKKDREQRLEQEALEQILAMERKQKEEEEKQRLEEEEKKRAEKEEALKQKELEMEQMRKAKEEAEEKAKKEQEQQEQQKQQQQKKEKKVSSIYNQIIRSKAMKIAEVMGGQYEIYLGVCASEAYKNDTTDFIILELVQNQNLINVYPTQYV